MKETRWFSPTWNNLAAAVADVDNMDDMIIRLHNEYGLIKYSVLIENDRLHP